MNKVTIGIVIAILAGFGGLVIVMSMQNEKATVNTDGTTTSVLQEATDANGNIADHVRGKADSKVLLVSVVFHCNITKMRAPHRQLAKVLACKVTSGKC